MSRLFGGPLGRMGLALGAAGLTGVIAETCLYNVDAGHRALIFHQIDGVKPQVIPEGTHFRVPILERPIIMDVRIRPRAIQTQTATKDMQSVNIQLRVLFHPSTTNLAALYRASGLDYEERVLPSIGNDVLKAVVAQFDASELLTLREHVSRNIRDMLEKRASEFNIIVDDVSITHLNFSKDFSKAIEDKQVAEQMAERAKFVVAKAEQEKEALIIRSEGDAQAALLVSDALAKAGTGLIELRRIETAQHIATELANSPNITYLPSQQKAGSGSNILLGLPASR